MITRKDIIQGSQEWLEVRWAKVGGTRSKGLFTKGDTADIEAMEQQIKIQQLFRQWCEETFKD